MRAGKTPLSPPSHTPPSCLPRPQAFFISNRKWRIATGGAKRPRGSVTRGPTRPLGKRPPKPRPHPSPEPLFQRLKTLLYVTPYTVVTVVMPDILIRNLSEEEKRELDIAKAKSGSDSWKEFLLKLLEDSTF